MRLRILLFFAVLNVLALASGFYVINYLESARYTQSQKTAAEAAKKLEHTPPTAAAPPRTVVVVHTNKFEWRQLESADYRQYIANLRSIGCPEPTIRDIIMTDVMRLYAQRRGQFHHNGREFNYWETNEKRKLKHDQFEQSEKQLALIDRDLPAVLRELLGINYEREVNKFFVDTNEEDRRLGFLAEDKRAQLLTLRDEFEGKRDRILAQAQGTTLTAGQLDSLNQIEAERREAINRLLSPEERVQFDLSFSDTADRLRNELIGFNPTEKEFREIFQRQQEIDARYQYQNLQDETVRAAKDADQAKMEEELKATLGETRMQEFVRSKDEEYRNVYTLSEQYDLPPGTTDNLVEMHKIVESERQKLLTDPQIPNDRRALALKQMRTETERQFRETLGEKAYTAYTQGAGSWIQGLGP